MSQLRPFPSILKMLKRKNLSARLPNSRVKKYPTLPLQQGNNQQIKHYSQFSPFAASSPMRVLDNISRHYHHHHHHGYRHPLQSCTKRTFVWHSGYMDEAKSNDIAETIQLKKQQSVRIGPEKGSEESQEEIHRNDNQRFLLKQEINELIQEYEELTGDTYEEDEVEDQSPSSCDDSKD